MKKIFTTKAFLAGILVLAFALIPVEIATSQTANTATNQATEARRYLNSGNRHLSNRNYDKAIEDYNEAVRLGMDHWELYKNRGRAHDGKQDWDRAIADYTEAIKRGPNVTPGTMNHFQRLVFETYRDRGLAYLNKQDFDSAIIDFTKVVELDFVNADALYNLGLAYVGKQDWDNAIRNFTFAFQRASNSYTSLRANALYNRGLMYENKNDFTRARADYEAALRILPDHANARSRLESVQQNPKLVEEQKLAQEQKQAEAAREAETRRSNAARIRTMVNFNGSYIADVPADGGGARIIKFTTINNKLAAGVAYNVIGRPLEINFYPFTAAASGDEIIVGEGRQSSRYKVLNNRTLQLQMQSGETRTFTFIPHQSLNGRTFSLGRGTTRSNRAYSFSERNYRTMNSDGGINGGNERTYTLENGVVSLFYNGAQTGYLWLVGPYLVSLDGTFWVIDN